VVIRPQGTYTSVNFVKRARENIRMELGIAPHHKMVIGVGYADLRKGFDLFMDTARRLIRNDSTIHFVWVGALSADMQRWIQTDFSNQHDQSRLHIIGFTKRIKDYYSAADCLYLSSREDPYPTVVLEAMNVGIPVVVYRATTGFDSLMQTHGYVVSLGDSDAVDSALQQALSESDDSKRLARVAYVENNCQFDDYCFTLLELLHPHLKRVSVVVPNYNYAQYLEQRLSSIYSQNYPVYEVVLLDDGSDDKSIDVAESVAKRAGRKLRVIQSAINSGSVYAQWKHAAQVARAELLWIAEADDSADPNFLTVLSNEFTENTAMAFCDSKQIGVNGEHLSNSYQHYFATVDAGLFSQSFKIEGRNFAARAMAVRNVVINVSGVLWDKTKLAQCFVTVGDELLNYQLAGDWRIYLELLNLDGISMAFVAEALNTHRRHGSSLTQTLDVQQHLNEIKAMHKFVCANMQVDNKTLLLMDSYLAELTEYLNSEQVIEQAA